MTREILVFQFKTFRNSKKKKEKKRVFEDLDEKQKRLTFKNSTVKLSEMETHFTVELLEYPGSSKNVQSLFKLLLRRNTSIFDLDF